MKLIPGKLYELIDEIDTFEIYRHKPVRNVLPTNVPVMFIEYGIKGSVVVLYVNKRIHLPGFAANMMASCGI